MEDQDYINKIRSALKSKKPSYETTNKKEIHVRCPYCGDSRHDPSKARLYIQMRPPFKFHCFRCETSGVLNQQVMRDLGLYDSELGVDIIEANKALKNNQKSTKIHQKNLRKLTKEQLTLNSNKSIQYINNRYATMFTPDILQDKFRAVLDVVEFAKINNIYLPKNVFDFSNSVGFISADKSHLILRDTSGLQQRRYCNLCLVSNEEDLDVSSKIYNMASTINVLDDEVTLVITEGIFDIIGVYNAFYKNEQNTDKIIFAAACGKAYMAVIQHFIRLGFLSLNIIIYSDADVQPQFFREMKQNSVYLKNNKLTVYYNSLYDPVSKQGKDYGVPEDQIKLKRIII